MSPTILTGAANSSSIGWDIKILLDLEEINRISSYDRGKYLGFFFARPEATNFSIMRSKSKLICLLEVGWLVFVSIRVFVNCDTAFGWLFCLTSPIWSLDNFSTDKESLPALVFEVEVEDEEVEVEVELGEVNDASLSISNLKGKSWESVEEGDEGEEDDGEAIKVDREFVVSSIG